ncbi:cell wall hydrolase [Novosphingobium rosa]|uniref:cell wall hydrolase n=1 Tax=Novosphingobium rosa TaxID=76978 RepID=UPI00082B6FA7|nr:cell wall hydrolase [Novosphingobium rosa]
MIAPVHIDRLWNAGLMAVLALACALVGYANWGMAESFAGLAPGLTEVLQPEPATTTEPPVDSFLPQQIQNLGRDQAHAYNLASPLEAINPAPPAFHAEWLSPPELDRATDCMASAIYYEAGSESLTGQLAVAQVILNRLRHPRYPKTVCAVVHQGSERATGCQFTYTCDGAQSRPPDAARLQRARLVAQAALHGATSAQAGQATHYHTVWIVPVWAKDLRKVAIIGNHVFYRPPGAYPGYPMPSLPIAPVIAMERTVGATPFPLTATIEIHPALVAAEKPQLSLANVETMGVPTIAGPAAAPLAAATASQNPQSKERKAFRFGHPHRDNGSIPLTGL